MRFYKLISTILHPIVIPTIGVMLYFLLIPNRFLHDEKLTILSLVFVVSYIIPLLILIILKKLKFIKTYQTESIRERKLPIALMIMVFYLLGNWLNSIINFIDLALLFYATSLIYILFSFKIKASIHLLSFGISTGFFLVLSSVYEQSYTLVIIIIILLAGLLASARLNLRAHTSKEVYIGFFIGVFVIFGLHYFL